MGLARPARGYGYYLIVLVAIVCILLFLLTLFAVAFAIPGWLVYLLIGLLAVGLLIP